MLNVKEQKVFKVGYRDHSIEMSHLEFETCWIKNLDFIIKIKLLLMTERSFNENLYGYVKKIKHLQQCWLLVLSIVVLPIIGVTHNWCYP